MRRTEWSLPMNVDLTWSVHVAVGIKYILQNIIIHASCLVRRYIHLITLEYRVSFSELLH